MCVLHFCDPIRLLFLGLKYPVPPSETNYPMEYFDHYNNKKPYYWDPNHYFHKIETI